jgi:hypothetical protein
MNPLGGKMDQNPESPNATSQPPSEWMPEPAPVPVDEVPAQAEPVVAASEQVIDVQAVPASAGTPPEAPAPQGRPLQPEIVGSSYQAPPPNKNSNGWVIALIILIVLCCCCIVILVPLWVLGGLVVDLLRSVYSTVVSVLNNIFGGVIQIIP